MFSATIPHWVAGIARDYFDKNMQRINMIGEESVKTSETVEHYALYVNKSERGKVAKEMIERFSLGSRAIVFTQMKVEANDFAEEF